MEKKFNSKNQFWKIDRLFIEKKIILIEKKQFLRNFENFTYWQLVDSSFVFKNISDRLFYSQLKIMWNRFKCYNQSLKKTIPIIRYFLNKKIKFKIHQLNSDWEKIKSDKAYGVVTGKEWDILIDNCEIKISGSKSLENEYKKSKSNLRRIKI